MYWRMLSHVRLYNVREAKSRTSLFSPYFVENMEDKDVCIGSACIKGAPSFRSFHYFGCCRSNFCLGTKVRYQI